MFNYRNHSPKMPKGYHWVIERGLVGFEPFTALQPWYFIKKEEIFDVQEKWPNGPIKERLIAFSRRQDCDDLACFWFKNTNKLCVLVIHGWTDRGYEVVSKHESFWDWLKTVVDDIAEWIELSN